MKPQISVRVVLLVLLVVFLIISINFLLKHAILALFVIINFIFAFSKRLLPVYIRKFFYGVEAILFCTVITGVSFGPVYGSIMGAFLMVVNYVGEQRFSRFFFLTIPLYSCIGMISHHLKSVDIIILGLGIAVIYNLVVTVAASYFGGKRESLLVFNLVNMLTNLFLFTTFGHLLIYFLSRLQ